MGQWVHFLETGAFIWPMESESDSPFPPTNTLLIQSSKVKLCQISVLGHADHWPSYLFPYSLALYSLNCQKPSKPLIRRYQIAVTLGATDTTQIEV